LRHLDARVADWTERILTRRAIVVVLTLAGAWFGYGWLFPGDTAQIRGVLARIADAFEGDDGVGVQDLARIRALQDDFAPDAVVDAGAPFLRLTGREAIVSAAGRVRAVTRNLSVRFPEIEIIVADDRQTAAATVTAEARFDDADGHRDLEAREFDLQFVRRDGQWVIMSVTLIPASEGLDVR
jgi:hypothetical protein